ncbi:MAG: hypothetical protein KDC07_11550, partial [Chitinophagaceae bacterium]|nr:hypothetical protein [Chitinophagaceae bacterium]
LLAAAVAVSFASCTTTSRTMREPNSLVKFEKDDFIFSDQVDGTAKEIKVLGIDWSRLLKKESGYIGDKSAVTSAKIPVVGSMIATDKVGNYALYNMMIDNPGYDVAFYPKYAYKVRRPAIGIGFIVKITEVKATARLAKITLSEDQNDD